MKLAHFYNTYKGHMLNDHKDSTLDFCAAKGFSGDCDVTKRETWGTGYFLLNNPNYDYTTNSTFTSVNNGDNTYTVTMQTKNTFSDRMNANCPGEDCLELGATVLSGIAYFLHPFDLTINWNSTGTFKVKIVDGKPSPVFGSGTGWPFKYYPLGPIKPTDIPFK